MIGTLEEMSAVDLVQVACVERQTARLALGSGDARGEVWFEDGHVVHAQLGRLHGKPALFEMLGWERGAFDLSVGIRTPLRTIDQSHSLLLLEAAEHIDRSRLAGPDVGRATGERHGLDGRAAPREANALASLAALADVEGVVLLDAGGRLLAGQGVRAPEQVAALALLVATTGDATGKDLGIGTLRNALVETEDRRRIVVVGGMGGWAALTLGEAAAPEAVAEQARAVLR